MNTNRKKNQYNYDLFIGLVGKLVTVEYGPNLVMSGILKFVSRYEISLKYPDIKDSYIIIPKHAIISVVAS